MNTVLMLDNDVGYLFAIGQELAAIGVDVIPATTAAEAESLLRELGIAVELLLANPQHPDAEILRRHLLKDNPDLQVVALQRRSRFLHGW